MLGREGKVGGPAAGCRAGSRERVGTLPVSRSIPANRLSARMAFVLMIPRGSSHGGLALAANPVPSWRWPCDSRLLVVRDDRDRLCFDFSALAAAFFRDLDLAVDTTELPPSWARTRRRGVPDSSAPCAASISFLTEKLAHGALEPDGAETCGDPPPVRAARAHGRAKSRVVHSSCG